MGNVTGPGLPRSLCWSICSSAGLLLYAVTNVVVPPSIAYNCSDRGGVFRGDDIPHKDPASIGLIGRVGSEENVKYKRNKPGVDVNEHSGSLKG